MEKNFYNYFNCNNKEELYSLIKDQNEIVKELTDYIEYAKENILERNYKIKINFRKHLGWGIL